MSYADNIVSNTLPSLATPVAGIGQGNVSTIINLPSQEKENNFFLDGIITIFTLRYNYVPLSVAVYLVGRLDIGLDYLESGPNEITFIEAPLAGEHLIIEYKRQ